MCGAGIHAVMTICPSCGASIPTSELPQSGQLSLKAAAIGVMCGATIGAVVGAACGSGLAALSGEIKNLGIIAGAGAAFGSSFGSVFGMLVVIFLAARRRPTGIPPAPTSESKSGN
jgi:hypothetical protein